MNNLFSNVEIEINSTCNRSCSYCPNSKYTRKELGEMDPKIFKELVNQLKHINFKGRISYHFFGEPLLCSSLDIYIAHTRFELPESRIVLYSNGDFLDENKINKLICAGVDRFIITKHEGISHDFEKYYDNLPVKLKSKFQYLHYKELNLVNRGGLLFEVKPFYKEFGPCYIPSSVVVVTLLGNVLPCFEDYEQNYEMGNIGKEHIVDIWNKKKYIEFRRQLILGNRFKYKNCSKCNNESLKSNGQYDYVL